MSDNLEFEEPSSDNVAQGFKPQDEQKMYDNPASPKTPNSLYLPLGKCGHISW